MAGEICMCADEKHSAERNGIHGKVLETLPGYSHMWHECTGCGRIYCDECGRTCLTGKNDSTDTTRICPVCGYETKLF
jgi:hypothetical protein